MSEQKKCKCKNITIEGARGPIYGRVFCNECVDAKTSDASVQALKLLLSSCISGEIAQIQRNLRIVSPPKKAN